MTKTTTTKKTTKAKSTVERAKKVVEKPVIDADAMAAAVVATTGNDYQQYIRNLFKDKLKRG